MSSIDDAFYCYVRHIYDEEKMRLLRAHNLKVAGSVPSVLWELFGSLLVERIGNGVIGADLVGWEVKSAKNGGSFEYQYHLNTGAAKLKEDCLVNHLFCTYSATYENVTVRAMKGSKLATLYFDLWLPEYISNYDPAVTPERRRQRFRKSIPFGFIEKHGALILEIQNGQLVYKDENAMSGFKGV